MNNTLRLVTLVTKAIALRCREASRLKSPRAYTQPLVAQLIAASLLIFPCAAFSGKDPIKWTLSQNLPATVIPSGGTYVASYVFTNEVPINMVKPLTILKTSNSTSEFTYDDLCTGKKLKRFESCSVKIYLKPNTAGIKSVFLTEYYGNNQVPLPQLVTTASDHSNGSNLNGVVTTALPQSLNISASAPWKFTFTNNGSTPATGINILVSGSTYNTNCGLNLSNLPPNNSCYVQGSYTANSSGTHTVSATFSYAQGAPVQVSTATNSNGQSSGLVCTAAVPLATETLVNSSTAVTLLCTNKSGSAITLTGHTVGLPANGTFTPGPGGDNCTNQVLNNNASCQLSGTYVAPASVPTPSTILISLSVNYDSTISGLSSQTSTSTDVVTSISNSRTIHLVNQCGFDVWWSMVGGAVTNSPACSSNADCPLGSSCNQSSQICYYNNYGPTSGGYHLAMNNGVADTKIIQTPASTPSDGILWKGLISASTKCVGTSCQNNDCQNNGGTTSCTAGVGFAQPATEAEFTLQLVGAGSVDTYDISNVNGFSFPISMATNQSAADYTCGTAGNNLASGNLNACDFSHVTPPTNMYYWVTNTGTACTNQNTCTDNTQICGLAFDKVANNFTKNCGAFLGYWAANQICQTNPSFSSPFGDSFKCNQYLASPFPDTTYSLTQLMKCSPPVSNAPLFNSCYLNYSGYSDSKLAQCCGCTDWVGIATPSASCPARQTDSQWTQYVEPLIRWMKQACPTSYSYPFDDKASTFQCTAAPTTEYTITFCPGTGSGLPANKTDGR